MNGLAFFGLACVAAIFVVSHAREERHCLRVAAVTVATNWLLFASYWIYAPLSPAYLVYGAGQVFGLEIPVQHEDMWALADLASMVVAMIACRNCWWAPMLWSFYLVCLCMHAVAWVNDLSYLDYKPVLDGALIFQLAVLFMMGGGGCADYLLGCGRSLRRLVRFASRSLQSLARTPR